MGDKKLKTEQILNEDKYMGFVAGVKLIKKFGGYIKRKNSKEWGVTISGTGKIIDINFKKGTTSGSNLIATNILKNDWEHVKP